MEAGEKKLWTPHDRNAGAWLEHDDSLYCAAYSSVASLVVSFAGYFRKANGEVIRYEIDVAPTSDRAVTASQQVFGAGFLLSCAAYLKSGNANRGQCYVRAGIRKGSGTPLVVLNQIVGGYTTDDFSPSFPFGKVEGPLEGPGFVQEYAPADPTAGANIDVSVPARVRWRLLAVCFLFSTDGNAANRYVQVNLLGNQQVIAYLVATTAQVASKAFTYSFAPHLDRVVEANTGRYCVPMTSPLMVPGTTVEISVLNIQAGDQISQIQITAEEWIEA